MATINDPDFIAQRYGHYWHNIDTATGTPPCLSAQASAQMTLPWSGQGGFTTSVASGNVMRIWGEPWNSTRPIQTCVNVPGTSIIGTANALGNPDPELSLASGA